MEGYPCKNGTSFGCGKKLPHVGRSCHVWEHRQPLTLLGLGPCTEKDHWVPAHPASCPFRDSVCPEILSEEKKQTNNNKKMGLKTLQQQMTWIKAWKMFSLGLLQIRNTSTDKDAATSVWVSKAGIKLTTIRVLSLFFSSAPVVYTSASLPAPCFDMLNKM